MLKTFYISLMTIFLLVVTVTAGQADHQLPLSNGFSEPPISVAPTNLVNLDDAFAPWDHIAGRTVFIKDDNDPYVTWRQSNKGYSYALVSSLECTIHLKPGASLAVAQHELGHCVGFADHTTADSPFSDSYDKVCDDPQHENYSPYSGVMSYCDYPSLNNWWGDDDVKMFAAADFRYRDPAPWAEDVWDKAYRAGVVTDDSDPWKTVTKQELMAFFDRAGLLD